MGRLDRATERPFADQPALPRRPGMESGAAAADLGVFLDAEYADFKTRGAARPSKPNRCTETRACALKLMP